MLRLRHTQWIPWSLTVICLTAAWATGQPRGSGATTKPKDAGATTKPAALEEDAPTLEATRPNGLKIAARGADLRAVLQMLSAQGKMNIIATKDVAGKVTVDLHDVTFQEALEAVLESSGFVYRQKGNFIYIYTAQQLEKILESERKREVKSFRLSYISATDAKALVTPALSKDGTIAITPLMDTFSLGGGGGGSSGGGSGGGGGGSGGGGSSTDSPTNYASSETLVVQDYQDNLKRIEAILKDIDVRPDQVLIEATILQATLDDNNALGIDFATLAGVDFNRLGATTTGATSLNPAAAGAQAVESLGIPVAAGQTNFAGNVPAGGLSIGFISNEIAFFIRALERVTDTTVLANPKLLVVNKQKGEVLIGRSDGYIASTTQTETSATAQVQFLDSGIRLAVRPFIGKDGYIRMQIHPEDSDGRVITVANTALPTKTTTEVTTNVMVRDGHTIVLGGLFRERTVTSRSQVPLAGNIPYLGTLFRSTADETKREEIIVLITPRIIRQEVDEGVSEQLASDAERFRVGARQGVRWWGRVRLANTYLGYAKQAMAEGDRGKALWNVDLALSMDPRLLEAIRLKEELTQKAYWSKEGQNSSVRNVLQQMMMQEMNKPVEPVITPNKPADVDKLPADVREKLGMQARPQAAVEIKPKVEPAPPVQPKVEIKPKASVENKPQATSSVWAPTTVKTNAERPQEPPSATRIVTKGESTVRPQEPLPSTAQIKSSSSAADGKSKPATTASEAK